LVRLTLVVPRLFAFWRIVVGQVVSVADPAEQCCDSKSEGGEDWTCWPSYHRAEEAPRYHLHEYDKANKACCTASRKGQPTCRWMIHRAAEVGLLVTFWEVFLPFLNHWTKAWPFWMTSLDVWAQIYDRRCRGLWKERSGDFEMAQFFVRSYID